MKRTAYTLLIGVGILIGSCSLFGDDPSKMIIFNVDEIVAPLEASVKSNVEIIIRFTNRCVQVDRVEEERSENVVTLNIFVIDEEDSCGPQPVQFEVQRIIEFTEPGEYTLASGDKTKPIIIR